MMRDRHTCVRTSQGGVALLEFALGAGVLIAVFAGVFDLGFGFYRYNTLKTAVNAGARYAALRAYDSQTDSPSDAFRMAVANTVIYGDPSGTGSPVIPGLSPENVSVRPAFANGVPAAMTVSIVNYSIRTVFGVTALTRQPSATYAYEGIYSP